MLDHRYDNVRVSSIMPGSVDTEFGDAAGRKGAAVEQKLLEVVQEKVILD